LSSSLYIKQLETLIIIGLHF